MTPETNDRLTAIAAELHDIANELAIAKEGKVAVELHGAANRIWNAQRMAKTGATVEDIFRQADEWCDRQIMPMDEAQRDLIKSFLLRS